MNKAKLIMSLAVLSLSGSVFSADVIPDPTVQTMTPPAGLPGATATPAQIVAPSYNEFNIQGVFIAENKNKMHNNKVFMNGGFYKVDDVVSDTWRVKSITRKKVTLVNTETKQVKNLNISGE